VVTADQLVVHAFGDYVLQSDWMANEKTKRLFVAALHAATYTLPFLLLTRSPWAVAVIFGTHAVIDRWRLARYINWGKNRLFGKTPPWSECIGTGYPAERPAWLAVWLMIITDNLMHVTINALALRYL
jgi:hypothetical protein